MKELRKNLYAMTVIILFVIAVGILALFLALFSSSTAVDGTTVGSVYIGDQKPNSEARKKQLIDGVKEWQKDARYSISFQNYSFVIGQTVRIDPKTGKPAVDEEGNILYDNAGLSILTFNYNETNRLIVNNRSDNNAVFEISTENKESFYKTLQDNFGSEVTSDTYFLYDELVADIIKDADEMNTKCDYDLYDYLKTSWKDDFVSQIDIENLDSEKVDFLVNIFGNKEIEIKPQKDPEGKLGFSAVDFFSKEEFANVGLTSSDMSIIATGFAAVVQNSSLTVTVKNQGYISDRYYAYNDMTARVNIKDGTDLRIMNPETHSYFITITKGENVIDEEKTSLKFKLSGCRFVNKFEITKITNDDDNLDKYPYQVVYNDTETEFEYDPNNENMDIDREKGCYYWITQKGINTFLYSYKKTIKYVDGRKDEVVEVYPKQEFYVGQDEYRLWTTKGYNE